MTHAATINPDVLTDISNTNDIEVLKQILLPFLAAAHELRTGADLLASWGLSFVLIWAALLGSVTIILYRQITSTSQTEVNAIDESMVDLALAGRLDLWKIFWGLYVTLSLALGFIFSELVTILVSAGSFGSHGVASLIAVPIVLAIPTTLHVISAILVWQSAKNTSRIYWTYLARAAVIAFTIFPIFRGVYAVFRLLP
ncbi:hypothetical protein [Undibacterium sp.]|uniref:hypothetical protein n=1 Tax=Undibacterium sp. TaxID=1914977 RepID=UPI0037508B95